MREADVEEIVDGLAALASRHGVSVVGGCCGTTPAHVAAMRRRAMAQDFSWGRAAGEYMRGYTSMLRREPIELTGTLFGSTATNVFPRRWTMARNTCLVRTPLS